MKHITILIQAILFLGLSHISRAQVPDITAQDLKDAVEFLSSDELKGRMSGSEGEEIAAKFLAEQFSSMGLELIENKGMQYFDVVTGVEAGEQNMLMINDNELKYGDDFVVLSFSPSATVEETGIVFVGYGIILENDSISHNDYGDKELAGQWALILRGYPGGDKANNPYAERSGEREKVLLAADHGAAGVIFINGTAFSKEDVLMDMFFDKSAAVAQIPVMQVSREAFRRATKDHPVKALEAETDTDLDQSDPSPVEGIRIFGQTDVRQTQVRARNVVAKLSGIDPYLKNEYVIIGAHYDHLGMGGKGSGSRMPDTIAVHNGADDNASGVAGLLELAGKMAYEKKNLRSIIFVAFSGEELGLLGSRHFVKNPPFNLKWTQAMINFDMIGRMKEERRVMVGGTGTALESEEILEQAGKKRKFELEFSPEGFGASDHAAFYAENVPVYFITTGAHEDYHTPFDDADRLDYASQAEVVEFTYDLAMALASRPERLTFREAGPKSKPRHGRGYKIVLGIMPDFASSGSDGLRVDGVRPEGPAGKAGMAKGDIIVALNGKSVQNIYDYMSRLKDLEGGMTVSVDIIREGKKQVLIVQL